MAGPGRVLGIRFDPPMAVARVGGAQRPVDAYHWQQATNPHRGVQTRIVPAPTLEQVQIGEQDGRPQYSLRVTQPEHIEFKDSEGRIRPVAPFFELWAAVQDGVTGDVRQIPVNDAFLESVGASRKDVWFRVTAANRKAELRVKAANCAAVARVEFLADDYARHALDAISPHTEGQVPMVPADHPLPLGHVQTFSPGNPQAVPEARLDQIRVRFTPGKGETYGPPQATEAVASPLAPGDFEPESTQYGRIHAMTRPENRFFNQDNPFPGFNFRTGGTAKWPTPMDSYDGARVGDGNAWGLIDDTCDLIIECQFTAQGTVYAAHARAFAGPPDFAPDRRPFYSIKDELDDRDLPPAEVNGDTEAELLDLFRRVFETASLMNLDQRRNWALGGNAAQAGAPDASDPDWDAGVHPHLGPKSMREADAPWADLVPEYTPNQHDTITPVSGSNDRLPYTMVVSQVHARMADSPILSEFLARRPDRVRRMIRPPFAVFSDLPPRVGLQETAPVPMAHQPDDQPIRYRDPRGVPDMFYDMRMPPYMRHSMGVPLSITKRHYDQLMAWLDALEQDPELRNRVLLDRGHTAMSP
ncbi:MAG: hypothetical protein AAF334_01630 [Pseudomonadota bacterium]